MSGVYLLPSEGSLTYSLSLKIDLHDSCEISQSLYEVVCSSHRLCPCVTYEKKTWIFTLHPGYSLWSHDNLQYNVGSLFIRLQ